MNHDEALELAKTIQSSVVNVAHALTEEERREFLLGVGDDILRLKLYYEKPMAREEPLALTKRMIKSSLSLTLRPLNDSERFDFMAHALREYAILWSDRRGIDRLAEAAKRHYDFLSSFSTADAA
jgi:hypothetical protein